VIMAQILDVSVMVESLNIQIVDTLYHKRDSSDRQLDVENYAYKVICVGKIVVKLSSGPLIGTFPLNADISSEKTIDKEIEKAIVTHTYTPSAKRRKEIIASAKAELISLILDRVRILFFRG